MKKIVAVLIFLLVWIGLITYFHGVSTKISGGTSSGLTLIGCIFFGLIGSFNLLWMKPYRNLIN